MSFFAATLRGAAAAACPALVVLGSCRQLARIDESGPCAAMGPAAGSCSACMRSSCCDDFVACHDDADCAALDDCISRCDDQTACRVECRSKHPFGFNESFAALASCGARSCPTCDDGCGGYAFPDAKCASCAQACCDETRTCMVNAECLALTFCERRCSKNDHECRGECQRDHLEGVAPAHALAACLAAKCAAECDYPTEPRWGCRNTAEGEQQGVTLQIKCAESAEVFLCSQKSVSCTAATAEKASKAVGNAVTLDVPSGFDGYLRVVPPASLKYQDTIVRLHPLPEDAQGERTLQVDSLPADAADLPATGAMHVSGRGHLKLKALDCEGDVSSGISFDIAPVPAGSTPYFGQWGESPGTATGASGYAGVLNLVPGEYRVRFIHRDLGACVYETRVRVAADTFTFVGDYRPAKCESPSWW